MVSYSVTGLRGYEVTGLRGYGVTGNVFGNESEHRTLCANEKQEPHVPWNSCLDYYISK